MTPIYHITHIANLPGILAEGALLCDNEVERRGLCQQSIAHDRIKERRKIRPVQNLTGAQIAAGHFVADYVPFYFANRSPMLYAIYTGYVARYTGREQDVVYLYAHADNLTRNKCQWCFTDGHAVEGVTEFFDHPQHINQIDWKIINSWSWKDTLADPDRKRKKQAEFLVFERVPWEWIEGIGVVDAQVLARVQQILAGAPHQPPVTVQPKWYYSTTTGANR